MLKARKVHACKCSWLIIGVSSGFGGFCNPIEANASAKDAVPNRYMCNKT